MVSYISLGGVLVHPGRACSMFVPEYSVREPHKQHVSTEIKMSGIGNQCRWKLHNMSGKSPPVEVDQPQLRDKSKEICKQEDISIEDKPSACQQVLRGVPK